MVGIAGGESDTALIGAANLDFGGVHDGIEEAGDSNKDTIARG